MMKNSDEVIPFRVSDAETLASVKAVQQILVALNIAELTLIGTLFVYLVIR